MSENQMDDSLDHLISPIWDPDSHDRCIVCNRPSNGKAICSSAQCAQELAHD